LARLDRSSDGGALHVVGRPALVEAAARIALDAARAGQKGIRRVRVADEDAVLKGSPLHGKSALRWAAKRWLWRAPLPRVSEYHNLEWLATRLFAVPVPLAAGGLFRAGIPRWQFLVTRFVADGVALETWLPAASQSERAAVLDEIAREVARMHALRFVHHDLWPRNLLVVPAGGRARVHFLDAWAGGPGVGLRGVGYDLRCFETGMAPLWTSAEAQRWRERYDTELRTGVASSRASS
jgi:hypothetical protein